MTARWLNGWSGKIMTRRESANPKRRFKNRFDRERGILRRKCRPKTWEPPAMDMKVTVRRRGFMGFFDKVTARVAKMFNQHGGRRR